MKKIVHAKVGSKAFGDVCASGEDRPWRVLRGDIDQPFGGVVSLDLNDESVPRRMFKGTSRWRSVGREASQRKRRSCPGEKPHLVGNAIKLLMRPIWAPACQRYLMGLALLMTHRPGHIIKAGPWPSSQRETPHL